MSEKLSAAMVGVAAFDGTRLRALIALILKYAPVILPYILPLLTPAQAATAASVTVEEADTVELSAMDWKTIIQLILQILAALFPPEPVPVPDNGPVASV